MISPDFFIDEKVGALSHIARLIFIGLWIFAEDNGVGRASIPLLRNQILPYDDISLSEFSEQFDSLVQSGMVSTYSVDHQQYYKVVNFLKYQKISHPTPFKLPTDPHEPAGTPANFRQISGATPPQYNIEKNNIKQPSIKEYGSEHNVRLTAKEYHALLSALGKETLSELIEDLSLYQKSTGKTYADHCATLRRWAKKIPESAKNNRRTEQLESFEKLSFMELHHDP